MRSLLPTYQKVTDVVCFVSWVVRWTVGCFDLSVACKFAHSCGVCDGLFGCCFYLLFLVRFRPIIICDLPLSSATSRVVCSSLLCRKPPGTHGHYLVRFGVDRITFCFPPLDIHVRPCVPMCRFYDLRLTAAEARVHFLANFLEVCRLNSHGCPWSLRRVTTESRVGELTGGLHPDYQASFFVLRFVDAKLIFLAFTINTATAVLMQSVFRPRPVHSDSLRSHVGTTSHYDLFSNLRWVQGGKMFRSDSHHHLSCVYVQ